MHHHHCLVLVASAALVLAASVAAGRAAPEMPLVLVPDKYFLANNGVCLDGSGPGIYFQEATNASESTKWVLYFKGGGWCYNEDSCLERAKTELGSRSKFPKTFGFPEGPVSGDASVNFAAGWNRAILWYCDGASFTGNAARPVQVHNTTLHFRGFSVLEAMLDFLMAEKGLDQATEVMLSGGSAGGLSTFIHADYVASRMPSTVTKYRTVPGSGFFLMHEPLAGSGGSSYIDSMRTVYTMQNSSRGVNQACLQAQPPGSDWRCIFANYSLHHTKSPVFPLQSVLDSWQMGNIYHMTDTCVHTHFGECTAQDIANLNAYASAVMRDMRNTAAWGKPGNGVFAESCLMHCGFQSTGWSNYKENGTTMAEAVQRWWTAPANAPFAEYPACLLNTASPFQCNPTCG